MRSPIRRIRNCACVFFATQLFQLIEDGTEYVGLIIGNRAGKIRKIFRSLNNRAHALETHSGIDVARREWNILDAGEVSDPGYRLRVELDENQIPNLDAARILFVHERAARVAVRRKIDVQF